MPIEPVEDGGMVVAIRINGLEFPCEDESGRTIVPEPLLTGIRLSEIPPLIAIQPVQRIGHDRTIYVKHNFWISQFRDGSTSALVEEVFRRKLWDEAIGLSSYVSAYRQAIQDRQDVSEHSYEDDGDYIFLRYEIPVYEDLEFAGVIDCVNNTIESVISRANQLAYRRKDMRLGLFDRDSFDADLRFVTSRSDTAVSLLMIDVNRFKKVNDRFGHPTGDIVLQEISQVLLSLSSDGVVAYRFGGDEFAVILTGEKSTEAERCAELIQAAVARLVFPDLPELQVTVSVGVAIRVDNDESAEDLLGRADADVYRAKAARQEAEANKDYSVVFIRDGSPISYDAKEYAQEGVVSCPKNCGRGTYHCLVSRENSPSQQGMLQKRDVARTIIGADCPFHEKRVEFGL